MSTPANQTSGFPMAVLVEGGLAVIAVALAWLFGVELRRQFPTESETIVAAIGRGILATLPMLAGFWLLVRSSRAELVHLRRQVEWVIGELFPTASYAQFALIAILAGVGEELLFRGVIQSLLGRWTTPAIGLAIASLLFGAAHALSRLYFLLATLIGAYLGWLALYYNDLVAPIVAHGLYDFLALVYLAKHRPR
jgi:uncharacterized protein